MYVGLAFCRETKREAQRRQGAAIKRHTQLLHSLLVQLFHKINEHKTARSHQRILASRQGLRRSGRCKRHRGDLMAAARCGISSSTPRARRGGNPHDCANWCRGCCARSSALMTMKERAGVHAMGVGASAAGKWKRLLPAPGRRGEWGLGREEQGALEHRASSSEQGRALLGRPHQRSPTIEASAPCTREAREEGVERFGEEGCGFLRLSSSETERREGVVPVGWVLSAMGRRCLRRPAAMEEPTQGRRGLGVPWPLAGKSRGRQ
jgi:hypothetical protein